MILKMLGNPRARAAISKAVGGEHFHAYIISGPVGSGKTLLARTLAQVLVCAEENRPCGRCRNCIKAEKTDLHPDIITVAKLGKRSIVVDQIRTVCEDSYILPNEGRHKVYILQDAGDMNPSAQNALLKVLEEPPQTAVFMLLCENPGTLLETVRSRCVHVQMEAVSLEDAEKRLFELFPESDAMSRRKAAMESGGIIGAAAAIMTGEQSAEVYSRPIAQALAEADEFALFVACLSLEKLSGEEIRLALFGLLAILRDAAMEKSGASRPLRAGSADVSRALAKRYSSKTLLQLCHEIQAAHTRAVLYLRPGNMLARLAAELYTVSSGQRRGDTSKSAF